MSRLADVFEVIESLKSDKVIVDYAIAGATAVLFYAEPIRTYDLDVFVFLPGQPGAMVSLNPLYQRLETSGFRPDAEHIRIHDVPVQFLPAYNELAVEALKHAVVKEYDSGISVRVLRPEHLAALAVQTGGRKRREHVARLLESEGFDRLYFDSVIQRHGLAAEWRDNWASR